MRDPNNEANKRLRAKTEEAEKQAEHMKARMQEEIVAARHQLQAAEQARDKAQRAEEHAENLRRLADQQRLRAKREQEAAEQAKRARLQSRNGAGEQPNGERVPRANRESVLQWFCPLFPRSFCSPPLLVVLFLLTPFSSSVV